MLFTRHPENPIVTAGGPAWRRCAVYNPGVIRDEDGAFYMLERSTPCLRPFYSDFGLLRSGDGVHFELVGDEPVFTAAGIGFPEGSLQDPRIVRIDGTFYMTYVLRRIAGDCYPTGLGPHRYLRREALLDEDDVNTSRSGIAASEDMVHWQHLTWVGPRDLDDRDNVLFPRKIGGRFAMLRRPLTHVGPEHGTEAPAMWISYSDDLKEWSEPELLAGPQRAWEGKKMGAAAPPIETSEGWLTTYHAVDRDSVYRMGLMLLDAEDPSRVLARTAEPVLEPREYYERFGAVIPNVIFPTGNVLVDGTVYLYYGVCDTAIALATAPLEALLEHLRTA